MDRTSIKYYSLFRIVDIDIEDEKAYMNEYGVYSEREIYCIINAFLYNDHLNDKSEIRNEMDEMRRNYNDVRLRMYMEILSEPFVPMNFSEMYERYSMPKKMNFQSNDIYNIWNSGVDFIFTDVSYQLT